jgi:hypothetical protein
VSRLIRPDADVDQNFPARPASKDVQEGFADAAKAVILVAERL